jgi:hypothetical protein
LRADRVIAWDTFLGGASPLKSNQIDSKVTSVVFDLPESTIPDDIKYVGNLPHRNLIRSSQIGLCSGEALADFFGISKLTPSQVEPDVPSQELYKSNGAFATPLWYYLLKEAELAAGPSKSTSKLGLLGSRLVAEVLVGGIYYASLNVMAEKLWKSSITNSRNVQLLDIAHFA